ncbi:MAG: ABC transporter permease subunit [Methanomassiliicoccales archaeon]|nr:ABC transporter permease subunit [Methanomassiliicoccales archaeon]
MTLPSDLVQSGIVARYEFLKHLRSRRLLGIFILEIAIIALILLIPPLQGQDYPSDPAKFAGMFVQWVWILIVIGSTLFAGDSLVSEFQQRTGYLLFPNPVKKRVLFIGKYAASAGIMFLALAVFYAVVAVFVISVDGSISGLMASSFGLAMLFGVAALSIGYVISSFMKGSTGALILTFALLLLILKIVDGVATASKARPDFSLTFSSGVIGYIMETPYPTDFVQTIDFGGRSFEFANYYPSVTVSIVVAIIYIIVTVALAIWLFDRREMSA